MKGLKMKPMLIPPIYFLLGIVLIPILFSIFPGMNLIQFPFNWLGLVLILFGGYLNIHSLMLFNKYNTSFKYGKSTFVINEGPFLYSRNPMYLGMFLTLIGLSICFGNILSLMIPLLFYIIMQVMFIPYEEKKMEKELGTDYLNYKKRVRKWV
jgi:protein-S-isoprenylcysteine O-methyltransferase Ste14